MTEWKIFFLKNVHFFTAYCRHNGKYLPKNLHQPSLFTDHRDKTGRLFRKVSSWISLIFGRGSRIRNPKRKPPRRKHSQILPSPNDTPNLDTLTPCVFAGIATAYTLLKQTQRAKNQLKRVAKSPWTFEDAEHLERCWLLLADHYVQSSKFDSAAELVNRILQHNKSCARAYEFLGYMAEKEQRFKEAAGYYDQGWRYGGCGSPSAGYKLAFCLMKCKRYPEAIEAAREVLRLSPDYPRARKDVLDKCVANLRV